MKIQLGWKPSPKLGSMEGTKMSKIKMAAVVLFLGASSGAHAGVLYSVLGGQVVYDPTTNLSWTSNANINGPMTWTEANTWANTLVINGDGDWRLPTSDQCIGFNCTGSEMGNLFYNELGSYNIVIGGGGSSSTFTPNSNYNLFSNFQSSYWSSTISARNPTANAMTFLPITGQQGDGFVLDNRYALAVHVGNVAAVPEPGAWALMASGLGLMGFLAKRHSKKVAVRPTPR